MVRRRAKRAVSKERCPECGSTHLIEDPSRGEVICANCGLILEENVIDLTQEWRAFDQEQRTRRARTGAPLTPTKHDKGMITEIGKGPGELFKVSAKREPNIID